MHRGVMVRITRPASARCNSRSPAELTIQVDYPELFTLAKATSYLDVRKTETR